MTRAFVEMAYQVLVLKPLLKDLEAAFSGLGGGSSGGWMNYLVSAGLGALGGGGLNVDTGGVGLNSGSQGLAGLGLGGGRASGGPLVPRSIYEVAEVEPELATIGGRTFLLTGDRGGQVERASRAVEQPASREAQRSFGPAQLHFHGNWKSGQELRRSMTQINSKLARELMTATRRNS